jgi:hypothetical protein
MADLAAATENQLRNIEAATGMTIPAFAAAVGARGPLSHSQIVAYLKSEFGLTYGNANAVAHKVRELGAGGPPPAEALLDAQYAGPKAGLRPIYEQLAGVAAGFGADVQIVVQKTGVAFRRRRQFGLVQAPAASRVQLGLNLTSAPVDPRLVATTGMCTHKVELASLAAVEGDVIDWLRMAYEQAG